MSKNNPNSHRRKNPVLHPAKRRIPPSEAGRKFGLSDRWQRQYIEAELAARRKPVQDPHALLAVIRTADDLDKPWHAQSLIPALGLPAAVRRVLLARLEDTETDDLTLKELMDVVVLGEGAKTLNGNTSALLVLTGIGTTGLLGTAMALTKLDMGPRCNALWYRRVANLKGPWACIPASRPQPPPALSA